MIFSLILGCVVAILPAVPVQRPAESKEYMAAYAKAQKDADLALKEGRAALFTYGLRPSFEPLDRQTGLPIQAVAGCIVNDEILGRAAGNNDRIHEYVLKNGLPPGSFKPWEKELGDLITYVAAQSKERPAGKIAPGGKALTSPDGKFSIRAVTTKVEKGPGQSFETMGYVLTVENVDRPQAEFFGGNEAEVTWGPAGSGFVVLRGRSEYSQVFQAIDMKSGRVIGSEYLDAPAQPNR